MLNIEICCGYLLIFSQKGHILHLKREGSEKMKYTHILDKTSLIVLSLQLICMTTIQAYTCTFKNNSHANLVIKFYRDSGKSDELVVGPLQTVTWNAGKVPVLNIPWSVKGMKVLKMKFNQKEILITKDSEDYWKTSRPYNPTWELSEVFPVEAGQVANKVQFTLKRNPGGAGGSTYPGGTIWTSPVIDL